VSVSSSLEPLPTLTEIEYDFVYVWGKGGEHAANVPSN